MNRDRIPLPPEWEGLYEFRDTHEEQGHVVQCQVFIYPSSAHKVLFFECESCKVKFWPSPWKVFLRRPDRTG